MLLSLICSSILWVCEMRARSVSLSNDKLAWFFKKIYIQAAYVTHGFGIVDLIIWVLNVWVGLTRTLWTAPVVSGGLFEGWECITGTQKVLKNQLEHSSGQLLKVWELKINWVKSSKGFRICRFQEGNPADTSGHPLVYFDVSNLTLTSFAVASVW